MPPRASVLTGELFADEFQYRPPIDSKRKNHH
jgi:hypothetical protein